VGNFLTIFLIRTVLHEVSQSVSQQYIIWSGDLVVTASAIHFLRILFMIEVKYLRPPCLNEAHLRGIVMLPEFLFTHVKHCTSHSMHAQASRTLELG
jgi:hypothetical protein